MKRKGLALLLILGFVFVSASISMANIPAPPVNQIAGFDDTEFNFLTAADCIVCHPSVVDARRLDALELIVAARPLALVCGLAYCRW